jgi:TM2 domain-containing membrane protein YozV
MRPASGLPGTSAEPPTAPYGYALDTPGSSSTQTPYLGQPPTGPATVQPYPGQQPSQQAGQQPYAQQGYSVPVPPAGYPGAGHGVQQPGYQQPGYPQPGAPWAPDAYAKSRVAAGLLGIFLGAFGVHRFYTGHTGVGTIMLLITVLSFGTLSFVTGVWGLVEGILYLTDRTGSYSRDARGRPLRG